jgi:hypothetical protein
MLAFAIEFKDNIMARNNSTPVEANPLIWGNRQAILFMAFCTRHAGANLKKEKWNTKDV